MIPSTLQRRAPDAADRRRAGFTFIELIVGLAIVVLLAAVITPSVTASIDRTRVDQGAAMLEAIAGTFADYHADINDNPGRLSHLTAPITTAMTNSCGNSYDNGDVNQWAGPYYQGRVLTTGGTLPVFVGTAADQLYRIPVSGNAAILGIIVSNVREEDLLALDRRIDGGNGASAGTILWSTPAGDGLYTFGYFVPVTGC